MSDLFYSLFFFIGYSLLISLAKIVKLRGGTKIIEGLKMKKDMLLIVLAFVLFAVSETGYAATNYYVWRNNPSPTSPFTNWAWAATSIQDAVNLTLNNDVIYVTNGTYDTGGAVAPGYALTNRVMINKNITVTSMNGAAYTIIKGSPASGGGCGADAVRCVYLTNNAGGKISLFGFTLSNGYTMLSGDTLHDQSGGGLVFPAKYGSGNAVLLVQDCVLKYNTAAKEGGGAWINYGIFTNCTFTYNAATNSGGGAFVCYGQINNSTLMWNSTRTAYSYGGRAYLNGWGDIAMNYCTMMWNTSAYYGGGAYLTSNNKGGVNNCTIISNSAYYGGGAELQNDGYMRNSLVMRNTATYGGGVFLYAGGKLCNNTVVSNVNDGVYLSTTTPTNEVYNCVVWGNTRSDFYTGSPVGYSIVRHTCSAPAYSDPTLGGAGNINADPKFRGASADNYRLIGNSPCVNTGTNHANTGSFDRDDRIRIRYGIVDMGCYETIYDGSIYCVY